MKHLLYRLALCALFFVPFTAGANNNLWQQVNNENTPVSLQLMHPASFLVYRLDETTLKLQMFLLSNNPDEGIVISLPLPDGSFRDFKVWQTPMMPDALAAKYPEIKTFTAEAMDNRSVTAKLDFTLYGFHAMIYDGGNTSFVDPFDAYHDGFYMVHYKKDETRTFSNRMVCAVRSSLDNGPIAEPMLQLNKEIPAKAAKTVNGNQLRTYRLALCANNEYCAAAPASATIPAALSKMTTSMNRVNGVFERELSVTLVYVANEDKLIWTTASGGVNGADPFDGINSDANSCLNTNQATCDDIIGSANYDIGHVFTTGAGGLSDVGSVCQDGIKAQSVTGSGTPTGDGFDIDYVAHEMGHELGADHPFNNGHDGSCASGNINPPTAYEPGSGSTIMAYAGICSPDNIQHNSDAYFHAISLIQIHDYLSGFGEACAVKTPSGNKPVSYAPFAHTYTIPYLTPFELYAPALTDSVADSVNLYCWEQWDLGDVGERLLATHVAGPIFRSYTPTTSNLRVFPKESMVLAGVLSDAGNNNAEGEKVPDVARILHFKCTFRDIFHNLGCITIPDDTVKLIAINTGAGFVVTSQNTSGLNLHGHSTQTIKWDVVGTDAPPINASDVDIFMSPDGYNWSYFIGTFPNNGSAAITMPNPASTITNARFKVAGHNNVFFNVNKSNFTVTNDAAFPVTPVKVTQVSQPDNNITIFPVPAENTLHITSEHAVQATVYNTLGQQVWQGRIDGKADIQVATWARGMYYIQFADKNDSRIVKRFTVR